MQTLNRTVHLFPFWSYIMIFKGKTNYITGIVLNIALFIPLGFSLTRVFKFQWVILISIATTLAIELIQYLTYRGMLDIDDLISNTIGSYVGMLLWKIVLNKRTENVKRIGTWVMLAAGFVGYMLIADKDNQGINELQTLQQFYFEIQSMIVKEDPKIINGCCYAYNRTDLDYSILIDGKEAITETKNNNFSAKIMFPKEKSTIQVRFNGYYPMNTGIWIHSDGEVDYVEEDVIDPMGLPKNAVLKAYSSDFDTYVYQDQDRILWLIGWDELDNDTEIIYHLFTDEPEKLPSYRVQYGFDNKGFYASTKETNTVENELEQIGHYRVFERKIPTEYKVIAVWTGYNKNGTIVWGRGFRPF